MMASETRAVDRDLLNHLIVALFLMAALVMRTIASS